MVHPLVVPYLPTSLCRPVPLDFNPRTANGPGQCLYRELVGIAERDHRYDNYLNSQECLVNSKADFLQHYRQGWALYINPKADFLQHYRQGWALLINPKADCLQHYRQGWACIVDHSAST